MNRLPTGMYQPGDSVLHRLNAMTKILCLFLMLAAVISTTTIAGYSSLLCAALILSKISGLTLRTSFEAAMRLKWFFLIIFIMNFCFYQPEDPWVKFWIFSPTYEGMMQGISVVMRVFLLLVFSNIVNTCTAPLAMTDAIERMLRPLGYIGIPSDLIAMILSVAIQFIPTLLEETDNIRKAQTARGARFDSKNLIEKGKAALPLLVPIFLAAFKRADELSTAMEARGYRTDVKRSHKKYERLRLPDWTALLLCIALAAACIIIK